MGHIDLTAVNADLGRNAPALVQWALALGKTSIVTTNFRPFEAVILHMVTQVLFILLLELLFDAVDLGDNRLELTHCALVL